MPRVPLLQQQAQLAPLPGPNVNSNISPAMLGGITAKAMQGVGEDMLRGGVILNRIQADEQERVNAVRVNDAMNKAVAAQLRLTHDPNEGYIHLKGEASLKRPDGRPLDQEYSEKFDTAVQQISSDLGNENQKQLFRQQAAQMRVQLQGSLQQHMGRQFAEHKVRVNESTIKLATQKMALEWGNPSAIHQSSEAIRQTVYNHGKDPSQGWDDNTITMAITQAISPGHLSVISSAADAGQLDFARSYLDQSRKEMTPEALKGAEKLLDVGDFEARTQDNVEKYLGEAKGDTTAALALVRKNLRGKEEVSAVQGILARQAERTHQLELGQRNAADRAWKIQASGGKIPPSLIAQMDGRDVHSLQQTQKANLEGGVKTDMSLYADLSKELADNPDAFKRRNLLQHSHQLSPSDLKTMLDKQHKVGKDDKEDSLEVVNFQSQVGTMVQMIGLKGEKAGQFNKVADDALYAEQTARKRKLTQDERQMVLDKLAVEITTKKGFFTDTKVPYYQAVAEGKTFTPEERDAAIRVLRKKSGDLFPSEGQITELLLEKALADNKAKK